MTKHSDVVYGIYAALIDGDVVGGVLAETADTANAIVGSIYDGARIGEPANQSDEVHCVH